MVLATPDMLASVQVRIGILCQQQVTRQSTAKAQPEDIPNSQLWLQYDKRREPETLCQ